MKKHIMILVLAAVLASVSLLLGCSSSTETSTTTTVATTSTIAGPTTSTTTTSGGSTTTTTATTTTTSATPTWAQVGGTSFSSGVGALSFYLYSGTPYVAFQDGNNSNKLTVMKYSGTTWETVGSAGFSSGGAANYTSIYVYNSGGTPVPYVSYHDNESAYEYKIKVMKYNSNSGNWEYVGAPGFSKNWVYTTSLFIYDDNGFPIPYVAYKDQGNSNKMTAKKYTGTTWEALGSEGFSTGVVNSVSLSVFNLNGSPVPYIAYGDNTLNKAVVKIFNGSSWVDAGTNDLSGAAACDVDLFIKNNAGSPEPYVAYEDSASSNKISVVKLPAGSTTWQYIGSAGISSGVGNYTSIYVANSTPYVSFKDYDASNRATVMKYNGSSWETVGSAGIFYAGSDIYSTSIKVYNGVPYLAIPTTGQGGSVLKYQ